MPNKSILDKSLKQSLNMEEINEDITGGISDGIPDGILVGILDRKQKTSKLNSWEIPKIIIWEINKRVPDEISEATPENILKAFLNESWAMGENRKVIPWKINYKMSEEIPPKRVCVYVPRSLMKLEFGGEIIKNKPVKNPWRNPGRKLIKILDEIYRIFHERIRNSGEERYPGKTSEGISE